MRLISLTLRNFKGCSSFSLEADGRNVRIFGDNAVGKTTLADAFFWCLFDKDSLGKKDFGIKTVDPATGEPIHHLEHEVELQLEANGKRLTLRKVLTEDWVKARGKAEAQFEGHTCAYYVNDVPTQKRLYDDTVRELCDEKLFRLLTDPTAFNSLPWQERRKVLFEVCGDISDAQVIELTPKLKQLPKILGDHSVSDLKKILLATRTKTAEDIDRLPTAIAENKRNIETLPKALIDTEALRKAYEQLLSEKQTLLSGGAVSEKLKMQRELEAELQDLRTQKTASARSGADVLVERARAIEQDLKQKRSDLAALRYSIFTDEQALDLMNGKLERLKAEHKAISAEEFSATIEDKCPACLQALPADKVEAARQRALDNFMQARARRLEENVTAGKALKAQLTLLKEACAEKELRFEKQSIEIDTLDGMLAQAKGLADQALSSAQDLSEDLEILSLEASIDSIKAEIEKLKLGSTSAIEALQGQIVEMQSEISKADSTNASFRLRKQSEERIAQLIEQQQKLSSELERIDGELYLCDEFVKAKVRLLTEQINSKFRIASFKLFDTAIKGSVSEICETTVDGVPYRDLNTGSRVNVGLDIINTLAAHYGFAPCIWIDNAESVTQILPTAGQQIQLVVSAADKELRVELGATQGELAIA